MLSYGATPGVFTSLAFSSKKQQIEGSRGLKQTFGRKQNLARWICLWRVLKVPKVLGLLIGQKEVAPRGICVQRTMFLEQPRRREGR